MVASAPPQSSSAPRRRYEFTRARGGVRRLVASLTRIVNLQVQIWLTQAKITVMRMALFAGLYAGAAVLALLAIIFLYIGAFRLLTDVAGLRPVWAYLIFGGAHLLLAGLLVFIGTRLLTKKDEPDEDDGPSRDTVQKHPSETAT